MEPLGWSILVVGFWNQAILSPDGIRKRLFQLPDGVPVGVEVAIDRPGPYRVSHDGVVVATFPQTLELSVQVSDLVSLEKASGIAIRALSSLPETPVSAAGVNFRYQFDELPDPAIDRLSAPVDDAVSDNGYEIRARTTTRTLAVGDGVVNFEMRSDTAGGGTISFNFHRDSFAHADLEAWLARTGEFHTKALELLDIVGAGNN